MTPRTARPWWIRPSEIPHSGAPWTKFTVPSIGSSTHRVPSVAPPSSSPSTPMSGVSRSRNARTARSTAKSTSEAMSRSPLDVSSPGARVSVTVLA